jgi:hypothetical protein
MDPSAPVDAELGGGAPDVGPLPRAAGALLAVGHCSGAGLLHGVLVALAIAHARLAGGMVPRRPVGMALADPIPSVAAA